MKKNKYDTYLPNNNIKITIAATFNCYYFNDVPWQLIVTGNIKARMYDLNNIEILIDLNLTISRVVIDRTEPGHVHVITDHSQRKHRRCLGPDESRARY